MMEELNKYEAKITDEQKELLVTFMEDHDSFAKSKFVGLEGRKTKAHMWEQITNILNGCRNGAQKSSLKWQRVWVDLKNKTKKKGALIRSHRRGTGGGPTCKIILKPIEERILNIITEEAVTGIQEDCMPFDSAETHTGASGLPPPASTRPVSRSSSHDTLDEEIIIISEEQETEQLEVPNISRKRRPSSSLSIPSEHSAATERSDVETTPSHTKRPRRRPTLLEEATDSFVRIGETLNGKMDILITVLQNLVEEKQRTNGLLRELLEKFNSNK